MTTTVKESPILFSGPMVRAILHGRKTMTRRIIKPQPRFDGEIWWMGDNYCLSEEALKDHLFHDVYGTRGTPYGACYQGYGDRIWVRETFLELRENHYHWQADRNSLVVACGKPKRNGIEYHADCSEDEETERCREELGYKWRPSIFMPRWASRITLEITDIGVERVQEITEEDAIAEGFSRELCEQVFRSASGKTQLNLPASVFDETSGAEADGWMCSECADKYPGSYRKFVDNCSPESDGPALCDCGKPLQISLTHHGVDEEFCDIQPRTGADAAIAAMIAGGIGDLRERHYGRLAQIAFATLWDKLNKPRGFGWEANPWVWVISFKVI